MITFRFELKQVQNIATGAKGSVSVVRGCEFHLDPHDPIPFEINEGPELYTGKGVLISVHECFNVLPVKLHWFRHSISQECTIYLIE